MVSFQVRYGSFVIQPVYERHGDFWHPTAAASGPWDQRAQHGGAPAALFADIAENQAPGLSLTRLTVELVKPVPVAPLTSSVEVHAGRSTTRVTIDLAADGVLVARAHALLMVAQPVDLPDGLPGWTPPSIEPGPEAGGPPLHLPGSANGTVSFAHTAMEHRLAQGDGTQPGPGAAWFRVATAIVEGEPVSPAMRVAAAADFGNGVSWLLPADEYLFTNPDLSIHLHRHPVGEWVGVAAQTHADPGGFGTTSTMLYDQQGPIGTATQSLLLRQRRRD